MQRRRTDSGENGSLAPCFHGGAFFEAVGERFDDLDRRHGIVNADVLDAWFPPSPRVLAALAEHLPWLVSTSPPIHAEGMVDVISTVRGVPRDSVLPAAGSSDLIFLALRRWLGPDSRALLLDPTYGEYAHVLEQVIGCRVERLPLRREDGYRVDPAALSAALARRPDLAVIVNPNSPTGCHLPRDVLSDVLAGAPPGATIWVDETYVEYAGPDASLESVAAASEDVVVCKSMSKVYGLSGVRAAYLCASPARIAGLRDQSPPWAVSLPAQVAAVNALQDPGYYSDRWGETHRLRKDLAAGLRALGLDVVPGCANFLLCHLPQDGPDGATVVRRCAERGVYLRDAFNLGTGLGDRAVRVAVKDAPTIRRILATLGEALKD